MTTTLLNPRLHQLCRNAENAWQRAEELERQHLASVELFQRAQANKLWVPSAAEPGSTLARDEKLQAQQALAALARDMALRESEKAAMCGWGLRIGRTYLVSDHHGSQQMTVQLLRPLPQDEHPGCVLCSGIRDGRPALLVLGRDEVAISPQAVTNVVDITSRLRARKPR